MQIKVPEAVIQALVFLRSPFRWNILCTGPFGFVRTGMSTFGRTESIHNALLNTPSYYLIALRCAHRSTSVWTGISE